ncbi:Transport inhibitor response 1-like protein [Acorus calamus]|uniref:Transport inhibitor response 1-like protein n=1 Tax=Acorus calamus TaxID=4465 RepID=A0AAV9DM96_ACOCL|nr:Transport inhibitor response 1-like protein [Acorus calamus]
MNGDQERSEDDDMDTTAGSNRGIRSSPPDSPPPFSDRVLENVLENVLHFLTSRRDRNTASLVCKSWHRVEALTRTDLFIGNCYAVSPNRAVDRFRHVRSVSLKGKPRFADFNLLPPGWGAHFGPWAFAFVAAYHTSLEKLCLKRMSVTDDDLSLLAHSLPSFRELVLVCCDGFGTSGLAVLAAKCKNLRVLDLIEDAVEDDEVDWISCFPDGQTHLESLIFDCVECPINLEALERLVIRSPNLRRLRLNHHVSVTHLRRLMVRAPRLTHLGTGSFNSPPPPTHAAADVVIPIVDEDQELDLLRSAFAAASSSLVCLSGFHDVRPEYLPAVYPVCQNLTSLNLSYAGIGTEQLQSIILHCHKLQNFWVLDSVRDEGLQAVAATCKDLRELRVFPLEAQEASEGPVSEVGLAAIAEGCRKLRSILYFCQCMTNAAVVAMSKGCPDLAVFRLCIMGRRRPDCVTGEPMDEGFGAIVQNCRSLSRLAVSGLLTDRAFRYIGKFGKSVRTLSVAFAGDSDAGLTYVLEGCPRLQKLEIRDSPFGDPAVLSGVARYYNMRFLWMSSCSLSMSGCSEVARRLPRLVVEIIRDEGEDEAVGRLYLYRSLDGPRNDTPPFVQVL